MDEYGLGYNEIIIPSRSVKNSDADNILESGPMTGSTTSFRIANGVYPDDSDGREVIASVGIWRNLSREPMQMFSGGRE